ncbi:RNA polymerase sigma factor [Tenacibaculum aestuarii]|uniref:RNA polymerase sigma factor n=1 Tax=Tenacibaculum aestuarii TaxID=362781 RepID=UPI0038B4C1DC
MAAQAQVYQLFSGKLFALCLKYSRNYQDAEDTLQDSFLTIFKKICQYNNQGSFEGWMKRITINTALQKYREKSPLQLLTDGVSEEFEEEVVLETESVNVDILLKLIQDLPDRYRLVFNLYVLDNYSHKEIASLLNITEGTSKSNLSRARQLLKKEVEVYQATAQKA